VILGFEQMNKYSVLDQDGNTVALMAEDAGGLGSAVGRQVLKRRRAFTATVFSPDGAPLPLLGRRLCWRSGGAGRAGCWGWPRLAWTCLWGRHGARACWRASHTGVGHLRAGAAVCGLRSGLKAKQEHSSLLIVSGLSSSLLLGQARSLTRPLECVQRV
jgi:hypothetical protein